MKHAENYLSNDSQGSVYYQYWEPDTAATALLLVVHGAGEHSVRYSKFADFFTRKGFVVAALDHPGHGRSDGTPGFIPQFSDYVDAVEIFHKQVCTDFPSLPQILIGHSMGGLISTHFLLRAQNAFVGCALSAPLIKTELEPGVIQSALVNLLAVIAPKTGILQIEADAVSRDPEVVADYLADPLVHHGKITARKMRELLRAMNTAQAQAARITLPMLIMHGDADRLTAPAGSRFLHHAISSEFNTLKIYPWLFHELFHEPEKEQVFEDLYNWIKTVPLKNAT